MRGVALRIGYENISLDYVYEYLTTRISSGGDIVYLIDGSSITRIT
ncbi:hypothetical protein [Vulcanisaeta distributa]|nr:hypothetical protein [Vulcanisaeta distributa]